MGHFVSAKCACSSKLLTHLLGNGLYDVNVVYICQVCPQCINSIIFNWVKMMVMIGLSCPNFAWGALSRSFGGHSWGRVRRFPIQHLLSFTLFLGRLLSFSSRKGRGSHFYSMEQKWWSPQYDLCGICKSPELSYMSIPC